MLLRQLGISLRNLQDFLRAGGRNGNGGRTRIYPPNSIYIYICMYSKRPSILEDGALTVLTSDLCLFLLHRVLLETKVLLVLRVLLALE